MTIHTLHDDFWNIRGVFRVGPLNIGTQASLYRRPNGRFVFLDAYTLEGSVKDRVMDLTDGGDLVDAVLHLHPFHTIHVKRMASMFPAAKQYGTRRHKRKAPELAWEEVETDSPDLHSLFPECAFTVPAGVHFIPDNENLHFASVLALHRASRVLHVDDTLIYNPLPLFGGVGFHPTLGQVLEPDKDAVPAFRQWADELITLCAGVEHLALAHARPFPSSLLRKQSAASRVAKALEKVEKTLAKHAKIHG